MERTQVSVFFPEVESTYYLKDEIASLDLLVEAQTRALKEKLVTQALFELEEDAAKLTELVRARKNKKEMLGRLNKSASVAR